MRNAASAVVFPAGVDHRPLVIAHGLASASCAGKNHGAQRRAAGLGPRLTRDTPRLCLPQGADQFLNAAAVATAGAGLSLMPDEAAPDGVRDAVARLLANASFRGVAARISASIASMPSPADVAAVLEALP